MRSTRWMLIAMVILSTLLSGTQLVRVWGASETIQQASPTIPPSPPPLYLPLALRARAPGPSPTPVPPDTVTVENVRYHALKEQFYGQLVNETGCTVSASAVTLYLFDADGLPLGSKSGSSMAPILLPGERTPFRVYWDDLPATWHSYVPVVHWCPSDRLTVDSAVLRTTKVPPSWEVTVTVRNQLPVSVQEFTIGTVLYGLSGEVVAYYHCSDRLGPLAPGHTFTVVHSFYASEWYDGIYAVGCAAFAVPSLGEPLCAEGARA